MPLADSYSKPECVWLDGRRVLLLGPPPGNPDLLVVFIQGKEYLLPADTVFERQAQAATKDQRSAEDCELEERIWKCSSKLERQCLARLAALNGTPIPDRYQNVRVATAAQVPKLLERQERRRNKQTATPPTRPEHELVAERRIELQHKQEERASRLQQHQARVEHRHQLEGEREKARRRKQQQRHVLLCIDELLRAIWAGV